MRQPSPGSTASTRIHCDRTGRSGRDDELRTYGRCPFCGDRVAGDPAHELVLTLPDARRR